MHAGLRGGRRLFLQDTGKQVGGSVCRRFGPGRRKILRT